MELIKGKINNNVDCPTLPETEMFYVVTEFMLGDADGEHIEVQESFKKLDKKIKNYILKLETLLGEYTEDLDHEYMGLEFNPPFTEHSYYSFVSLSIIYLDKDRNILPCTIQYDENEMNILKAFKNK